MQTLTDPLHSLTFGYDGANRPISTTLPDTNTIGASFDANSNLTSLTPPGRGAHAFAYQGGDLEQDYTPPLLGVATHVHTDYDLDRNLLRVLPDGLPAITPTYDITNGRLMSVTFNAGVLSYDYVPASGRVNSVTAPDLNKLSYGYDGPLFTRRRLGTRQTVQLGRCRVWGWNRCACTTYQRRSFRCRPGYGSTRAGRRDRLLTR
jgi:YD repeat-containing protein